VTEATGGAAMPPPPPTGSAMGGSPAPAKPVYPPPVNEDGRPWWSSLDILLGLPFIFVLILIGGLIGGGIARGVDGWDGSGDLPVYGLFVAVLFQQVGQGLWPWIVSKWKGLGMRRDWGFFFDWPRDIGYGFAVAVACLVGSGIMTTVVSFLVDLGDDENASNTQILSDNEDSPWLLAIILLIVIGAPLTEELLFRGLILRALEKNLGIIVAVIGSTLLFMLPHAQAGATLNETLVLFGGIGTVGLVLALFTVKFGRLGPAIIGHFLFNAFGTTVTLLQ